MFFSIESHQKWRVVLASLLGVAVQFWLMPAASAVELDCHHRETARQINDAVFALKATQYCTGVELPYTEIEVFERLEHLRCGDKSSQLIDELVEDFDEKYRLIMTKDPAKTVCNQAAQINIDR